MFQTFVLPTGAGIKMIRAPADEHVILAVNYIGVK